MELAYEECKMPVIHILNMLKVLKKKINIIGRQRGEKQMERLEMKNSLSKICDQIKRNLDTAKDKISELEFIKSLKLKQKEKKYK